ncbi:hypothetical protein MKW98_019799 [Papaver atlanticum]|uniref:Uncharacterized protein n=1 Tax=Papaver atlanticum TaxID=357466 RepID=A0AAD4TH45_9MAGN|nr:hypothetical protein MKW98_019799 [Papaver atlanticum]
MASFRSYPPQPPPPSNQNPVAPPLPGGGSSQSRGFSSQQPLPPAPTSFPPNYQPNSNHHYRPAPPQPQQAYPYQPPPVPPQPYPATAAPPPMPPSGSQYYPASQYSQFHNSVQPPTVPPPPGPPPPSSPPPPPPPSVPPPSLPPPPPPSSSSQPHHQSRDNRSNNHGHHGHHRGGPRDSSGSGLHDQSRHHSKHGLPPKQHKSSGPPPPALRPGGRVETEEERRIRKKREYEKQRQEEKHRHQAKESQSSAMQKAQIMASGAKGHGSIVGSRMGAGKSTPFLNAERIENRLKKPTTFLCKLKFRNELPDPTAQPKLMLLNTNKDLYTKYTITSLEKMHKPKLFVEPDLGIPLDLLDISVYNPPDTKQTLAPEDKELLRDAESTTPIKQDGIKRKERPTDKGLSWLVKTEYISPISMEAAKTPLSEKQAKDLREIRGGRHILDNTNNREKQIQVINASFEACKSRPVHATNKRLQPVEILPLLPDFDRSNDKFVMATFDGEPTADSEVFSKLDKTTREVHESQAIMKSFTAIGSDPAKPDKFLAYMAPSTDELWKDVNDESEDISYSWVREYQWDVRGDDAEDHATYIVALGEETARYFPLPTKLVLRKKRAKDGRSNTEVEHYPVPASVTVRNRPEVSAKELVKDSGDYTNSKGNYSSSKRGRSGNEDNMRHHKSSRVQEMDNYSGGEDEMSD